MYAFPASFVGRECLCLRCVGFVVSSRRLGLVSSGATSNDPPTEPFGSCLWRMCDKLSLLQYVPHTSLPAFFKMVSVASTLVRVLCTEFPVSCFGVN